MKHSWFTMLCPSLLYRKVTKNECIYEYRFILMLRDTCVLLKKCVSNTSNEQVLNFFY